MNEELVMRGAAIARRYPPDTAMANRFAAAQELAKTAGVGLWGSSACGPSLSAKLKIIELQYDAPGNDNDNLNEECVVIRNDDTAAVELTGWY